MTVTVHDMLVTMGEIIGTPEKWTKGSDAIDSRGARVSVLNPDATSWCLRGAYIKAAHEKGFHLQFTPDTTTLGMDVMSVLRKVLEIETGRRYDPVSYNDDSHTTHEDMMLLLKKAIALAEDS